MNEKRIIVNICNNEYEVRTTISLTDLKEISEALQDDTADFQKVFAQLIYGKIVGERKPTLEELCADEKLKICAEKFVLEDSKTEKFYKINCEKMDIYKAVLTSIHEKCDEELKKITKNLLKVNNGMLEPVVEMVNSLSQSIVQIVKSPIMESAAKMAAQIAESLGRVAINVGKMLQDIKLPTISEERKKELIMAYKAWGSYGWTMMPDLPVYGFSGCPADIKEANKLALRHCTNKKMEKVFNILREQKGVKKSDLEEAIFDFRNGKYKSCALILFALIDAKLIRLQPIDKSPNGKRRASGVGAAKKVLENIKKEKDLEKRFFLLLDCENVFACLNTVFASGDDFRIQPIVINRNFVDHGMMTKKVIRKDCVQLFLLYYNMLVLFELV